MNSPNQTLMPDRGAIMTKAALRAADRLEISGRRLAEILGLSEAQISRFKRAESSLADGSKAFELAAMLVRVFRSLDSITGGDETVARAWMVAPNTALAGKPIDRIGSVQGLVDVVTYLDARRAPI